MGMMGHSWLQSGSRPLGACPDGLSGLAGGLPDILLYLSYSGTKESAMLHSPCNRTACTEA